MEKIEVRDERSLFDQFWEAYPKKVDKGEAKKLFNKLVESLQAMIIVDIARRKAHHYQWRTKEFVPSPARYLRKKLWNDEIIEQKTIEDHQADNEDGSIQARFWTMLLQMYGSKFKNSYGEVMPSAWRSGLRGLTQKQASGILAYLANDHAHGIPDLPKINSIKKYVHGAPIENLLPPPKQTPGVSVAAFKELKTILRY